MADPDEYTSRTDDSPEQQLSSQLGDHFVYVLECADDTLYTGYTTDVERRLEEHNDGDGAKYTRGRRPVELVYVEQYDSKSAAMSREYEIKSLSRTAKERVIGR